MLTFMAAWNDYFWPLVVLSPENPTVQVALSTLAASCRAPSRGEPVELPHLGGASAHDGPGQRLGGGVRSGLRLAP
jgi:hypothetical protein